MKNSLYIAILFAFISNIIWINNYCSEKKYHKQTRLKLIEERINKDTIFVYIHKEINQWDKFVDALIQVESRGDSLILGDQGNSAGCLQIQKSYVDYVNEFGNKNFTYDDRFSREKSIEIFESMQSLRNKDRNIIKAIQLHNPRAGDDYYRKIFTEMFK